jgi:hypothetical protein
MSYQRSLEDVLTHKKQLSEAEECRQKCSIVARRYDEWNFAALRQELALPDPVVEIFKEKDVKNAFGRHVAIHHIPHPYAAPDIEELYELGDKTLDNGVWTGGFGLSLETVLEEAIQEALVRDPQLAMEVDAGVTNVEALQRMVDAEEAKRSFLRDKRKGGGAAEAGLSQYDTFYRYGGIGAAHTEPLEEHKPEEMVDEEESPYVKAREWSSSLRSFPATLNHQHTHTHTHIHTYIHTDTHTYTHKHMRISIHTNT